MQLTNQILEHQADDMLNFYKTYFGNVSVLYCNKCENPIAILCKDPVSPDTLGLAFNESGYAVVPVGDGLLSSRVRLDVAANGERMLGFQCGVAVPNPNYETDLQAFEKLRAAAQKKYLKLNKDVKDAPEFTFHEQFTVPETIPCGNNTLLADAEVGLVPVGGQPVDYANPFEKHKIMEHLKNNPKKADFSEHGHIRRFESFRVEKV